MHINLYIEQKIVVQGDTDNNLVHKGCIKQFKNLFLKKGTQDRKIQIILAADEAQIWSTC